MPFYRYTAKSPYGNILKGKVEAQTKSQAAAVLRNRSLLVISLQQTDESGLAAVMAGFSAIKEDEVVNFTRQLSTMVTAGLNLTEALDILRQQSKGQMLKVIDDVLHEVEGGSTFATALEKQGHVFTAVYTQLVRAGETAGVLDEILARLAETLEKQKEFRSKTEGALIYPMIVIVAMLGVGFVMMVFVVPKLTAMYTDLGAQLPLPTQILILISTVMQKGWFLILGAVAGGTIGFQSWKKTKSGKLIWDRFTLKIPIMGKLSEKMLLTEFCRTMGLLLGAGISLLQALEIVGKSLDNQEYANSLMDAAKEVEKGVPLSQTITRYKAFPPILTQMIGVGEETGKLNEVLLKLGNYFEAESEQEVKNMTAAFEPLIMIVMGLGVGALVLAIIMPIYNLTTKF